MEISIDYAGIDDDGIIVPSVTPSTTSRRATARASGGGEEDGVVITPDPSGIVIKTRLTRKGRDGRSTFFMNDDSSHDVYVPPSLSGICNFGSPMDGGEDGDGTKVFVNICTHPLIASPGQRKGLDERTG
ncbi:hypothetical protein ACHAW5_010430 [Stephanodiscus triporus]|uniref:Uncharacterized protein n=1 Tax=Stephanodiscus triporus TaxID=2934178 RepID=A0ABD3P3E6_9STRA